MSRTKLTLRGGVLLLSKPPAAECPAVEPLTPPPVVTIPLIQHSGRPAAVCVAVNDHIAMGQIIGKAEGLHSSPVHASVSGRVVSIDRYPFSADPEALMVTIENNGLDEFASPIPYDTPVEESRPEELLQKIALSGIVDRDGVSLHFRCVRAREKKTGTLLINGLITEPFMHAEERVILDRGQAIISGAHMLMRIIGATRCRIIINEKRPDLAEALSTTADTEGVDIALLPAKPKYPHHRQRLLASAYAHCMGHDTTDSVVIGVEAAAAVREALMDLRPCYERIVTVAGPTLAAPKNLLTRIGTPAGSLINACGVDPTAVKKIVAGGPVSGNAIQDLTYPVVKTMNALIALDTLFPPVDHDPCIRCGLCRAVCPMGLEPERLMVLIEGRELHEARQRFLSECIECGSCAYVCPSRINLVHWLRYGKFLIQRNDTYLASDTRGAA